MPGSLRVSKPCSIRALYGSRTSTAQLGELSMWLPAINVVTGEKAWRNITLLGQLCQPTADCNLLSVEACQQQGMVSYFDQHCSTLPGGWITPFSNGSFYLDVVYAPSSTTPPRSLLPATLVISENMKLAYKFWELTEIFRGNTTPLSNLAVRGNNQTVGASAGLARAPTLTPEETQAWRVQGFPFNKQWLWSYEATTGHGLTKVPTPVHMFSATYVLGARMRALPYNRTSPNPRSTEVGELIQMDFQLGLPKSVLGFTGSCSLLDDYSAWGKMTPVVNYTAATALVCLKEFVAELSKLAGAQVILIEVLADNVPFNSEEFKAGLRDWPTGPVTLTNTASNEHRQAGRIERFHGSRLATANVLLAYGRLPSTWWPFATNAANMQANMLPNSYNPQQTPHELVSGQKPSWEGMHVFGTAAMINIPPEMRSGTAKQVAARGHNALYLGAAWNKKASHFLDMATGKFVTSSNFKLNYSKAPPGWPIKDSPNIDQQLETLVQQPDLSGEITQLLMDELNIRGGTAMVPSLPNLDDTGAIVTPPDEDGDDEVLLIPPLPAQEAAKAGLDIFASSTQPAWRDDESSSSDSIVRGGVRPNLRADETSTHFGVDQCNTTACDFAKGHGGLCSNLLPAGASSLESNEPLSSRLRSKNSQQGNFSKAETGKVKRFVFQAIMGLGASSTVESTPGAVPNFAFVSMYNEALHVDTSIGAASIPIPKGLRAALASEHAEYWVEAVLKEYTSILSHDVFKVVRRCDCGGVPVLRCHLLFNIKSNADGSIDRFKSRLVVDGCAQTAGIDFDAIFATVVKFATFRMAIHLAAVRNYNVTGIDVSTAFLYGLIDKDVYMMMPEGLPRYDEHGNELICKLLKSIYGLRQASRIWYEHFFASMVAFGFVRSDIDPCLFIYKRGGLVIYALLWVDDLIMLDNCADLRNEFVNFLKGERKYALTDRGELTFVLGLTLLRDRAARTIEVGQKLYVDTACKRFGGHLDKSNLRSFDVPATKELADFSPDDCPAEGSLEQLEMQPLRAD